MEDISFSPSFFRDSDVYKYVRLWAGGFHRQMNKTMRSLTPEEQHSKTPYMFYIFQKMFQQLTDPSVSSSKEDVLDKGVEYIYRGTVDHAYLALARGVYNDSGFMAFSTDIVVAKSFADRDRRVDESYIIFKVKTKSLPNTVRVFIIDQDIDTIYHEQEVLLPPGRLKYTYIKDGTVMTTFKPNTTISQKYLSMETPSLPNNPERLGGGRSSKLTDEDFYGKTVVFYRAIKGRPVETFWSFVITKENYKADLLTIERTLSDYDRALPYITEYTDLLKRMKSKEHKRRSTPEDHLEDGKYYMSFTLHAALCDTHTKEIILMDASLGEKAFTTMFGPAIGHRREEIQVAITKHLMSIY